MWANLQSFWSCCRVFDLSFTYMCNTMYPCRWLDFRFALVARRVRGFHVRFGRVLRRVCWCAAPRPAPSSYREPGKLWSLCSQVNGPFFWGAPHSAALRLRRWFARNLLDSQVIACRFLRTLLAVVLVCLEIDALECAVLLMAHICHGGINIEGPLGAAHKFRCAWRGLLSTWIYPYLVRHANLSPLVTRDAIYERTFMALLTCLLSFQELINVN